ncbi:MAG: AEC family transporter [Anaerolineae bacterium]|jgi:predicted permease|nr:AEC family transporter [Anaerolineae bacterium]
MDHTTLIINRVLPILILISLGYWIRRSRFLSESTVDDLRKIVVNIALPSVLFISFLNIELKTKYIVIFITAFVLCVGLAGFGRWLHRRLKVEHEYFPFLMTGFEYGMLGVSLFGSAYGLDKIGYIAVVDLGHELFIWFVFLALLLMKRDGHEDPRQLVRAFFTSPVIIGILAGIALNILDAQEFLYERIVAGGVMSTLEFLGNLTIPLILIIVGYGIKFERSTFREAALVIGVRLALMIPLALLLNIVLIRGLLDLEEAFEAALFTLLILPPPFIIPLYMKPNVPDERRYINNVLTLYTVVSIIIFATYFAMNPEI